MNSQIWVKNKEGQNIYEIILDDSYDSLRDKITELGYGKNTKVCIITDTMVEKHWLQTVKDALTDTFKDVFSFSFYAGEESKNLRTVQEAYSFLLNRKMQRSDLIIALGGGVVGDLAGFVAATYMRGIAFIQVPTTLLSMVDSSIGGKTAVDFDQQKNIVGAFYMPKLVYANMATLETLPKRQLSNGMAEIVKSACIRNANLYEYLTESEELFRTKDSEFLQKVILDTCNIKRQIVENDPYEKGERMLLNFGHTIGHAVETLCDFKKLHGECVSIGTVAAGYLSMKKGLITNLDLESIKATLAAYRLPLSLSPDNFYPEDVLKLLKTDKKSTAGRPRFVLLNRIGDAYVDTEITDEEIMEALRYVLIREK